MSQAPFVPVEYRVTGSKVKSVRLTMDGFQFVSCATIADSITAQTYSTVIEILSIVCNCDWV
jgi:hypothetical protein